MTNKPFLQSLRKAGTLGCIFFGDDGCPMTWSEAVTHCRLHGAILMEPEDGLQSRIIANLFNYEVPPSDTKNWRFKNWRTAAQPKRTWEVILYSGWNVSNFCQRFWKVTYLTKWQHRQTLFSQHNTCHCFQLLMQKSMNTFLASVYNCILHSRMLQPKIFYEIDVDSISNCFDFWRISWL